jgi:hypothetical protein
MIDDVIASYGTGPMREQLQGFNKSLVLSVLFYSGFKKLLVVRLSKLSVTTVMSPQVRVTPLDYYVAQPSTQSYTSFVIEHI